MKKLYRVLVLISVLLVTTKIFAQPSFSPKTDFATGVDASAVAIHDLDGDGKPDLVVTNLNSNNVSVFSNTSTPGSITAGSLATKVDFPVIGPWAVVLGDIDGDNKPDLVIIEQSQNKVSVLRNTTTTPGNITFAARVDFATGTQPWAVAVGDIDGDGKLDIVVANASNNTVSALRNTSTSGSITFANRVDFATGSLPYGVALRDVDGDSKLDIIVANESSNTVSVFQNTSTNGSITTGSFAAKVDFTTGAGPYGVALGDLDGDGKPDLVVANYAANTMSLFRNISTTGSITTGSFAAKVDFTTGALPKGVVIGDVDCDGKPDIFISNLVNNSISAFHNKSVSGSITTGSFDPKVDFTTGLSPYGLALGDLDGDGKLDLSVANLSSNSVSVYRNLACEAVPTVTPGGPNTVCQSATPAAITLSGASVGGSATTGAWSITSGGGTLSDNTQTMMPAWVTYTPAANFTGTVTLTLTSNGTPAASGTRTITVNALPAIDAIAGTATVCVGSTTQLTDATVGGTWASVTTGVATVVAGSAMSGPGGLVTGVSAGTSVITYTLTIGGCTNSVTQTVTVNAVSTITGTTPGSVCGTGTVTLGATASSGTINWYDTLTGGTSLGTGTTFTTPNITTTTTYYVDATDACGTTAVRTAVMATINTLPDSFSFGYNMVCPTSGATGFIYVPESIVGLSYQLYNSSNSSAVGPAQAGTGSILYFTNLALGIGYNLVVTNPTTSCSISNNLIYIVALAEPTITTSGTVDAVCYSAIEQTTNLVYTATSSSPTSYSIDWNAAANAAGLSNQGSTAFTFTAGGGLLPGITIPAATAVGGPYSGTMTIRNANGCTTTQAVTISVNALPTPVITGSATACAIETGSVYSTPDVSGHTYSWTVAGGTVTAGTGTNSITVSWGAAGAGTVDVTETITATGCSSAATQKTVTINAAPTTANAGADQTGAVTCGLTTVSLSANTPTSGTGAWSITSGTGGSFANSSLYNTTFTGVAGTAYTLRWTISNAICPASTDEVLVTFNQAPIITGTTPGSVCGTGTVTLGATASVGTINWYTASTGGSSVGTGTSFTTNISSTTTYYAEATDNGCTTASRTAVTATVVALPTVSAPASVAVGSTITLSPTTGGTWISNYPSIAFVNASTGLVTGLSPGTATFTFTDAITGCSATTASVAVGSECIFLCNTDFENPVVGPLVPGYRSQGFIQTPEINVPCWHTTASDGKIEIWDGRPSAMNTTLTSLSGNQFAELNCTEIGTLYQKFTAIPNRQVLIKFLHMGRYAGLDKMEVQIGPDGGTYQTIGTYYDNYAGGWSSYSIPYLFSGAGGPYQIRFVSISSNGGDTTTPGGNFLDNISIECLKPGEATVTPGGPDIICQSASPTAITLSGASVGGTATMGTWSIVSGNGSLINNGPTATPSSASYIPAVNDNIVLLKLTTNSIPAISATRTITINPLPAAPAAITGTFTLCVGSTTLLADATTGGTWTSVPLGVATVGASTGLVTGVSAGTALITYTSAPDVNGCTNFMTQTVTVNANPTITGITPGSVCETGIVTLGATASAGTINWYDALTGGNLVGTGNSYTTPSNNSTTTYYVEATANGCTTASRTAVTATVVALPTVAAITGTFTLCVGSTTILADATSGGTWSSAPANATISTDGLVTGVAAGTSVITYTVADGSTGCTNSVTQTVTINALPTVAAITGTATVCVGSTTLLADATTGGTWTSVPLGVATVGASTGLVTGVSAGTSVITYTVADGSTGCTNSVTQTVTVNALPTVAAITGTATVCVGSTTLLADVTTGGTWSSVPLGVATVGASTGLVTGIAAGTSVITYTVADGSTGCTNSVTQTVTINALPTVAAITGTATVCVGSTTLLADVTTGGTWSSVPLSVATVGASTGLVTGVSAGTSVITYTVADGSTGCTNSVTQTVTVNALPTVAAITGTATICVGSTTQLADATSGGTWSSVPLGVATVGASTGLVTGVSAGTSVITYTVADGSTGCTNSVTQTVTVNALPTVAAITGTATICVGSTTQLADATTGGTWSSVPLGAATVGASTGLVTGVSAGTSVITYTIADGSTGCTNSVTQTVTINALPTVAAITGTATVCVGSTTQLADATSGGTWSSGSGVTINASTGLVSGVSAGTSLITYTVTSGGCTNSVTQTVTVNALPTVAPITGKFTICVGITTQLSDATAGGIWTSVPLSIATVGASTGLVTGVSAGTSLITYTITSGGCTNSVTQTVTVNALPVVSAPASVAVNGTITLSPTTGGTWISNYPSIAFVNASTGLVTGLSPGTATFTFTDAITGCSATTASVAVGSECIYLCNPDFEEFLGVTPPSSGFSWIPQANISCWKTTATDGMIEIWHTGYGLVPAHSGNYFAEINATQNATLYQTFSATVPQTVVVSFWHRGRFPGVDVMKVSILAPDLTPTPLGTFSDNNTAWNFYSVSYPIAAPGTYTLRFESISSDNGNGPADGGNFLDDINVTCPGSICGMKFNDLDGDGHQDSNEPGIPNWPINLSGPVTLTITTDANGNYCFNDLPAGTYIVSESGKNGWKQTFPNSTFPFSPPVYSVALSGGQHVDGKDFGNKQTHFIVDWIGNGIDHMNINIYSAKLDGVDLEAGDEIGIFDGNSCVGVGILSGIIIPTNTLDIVVSKNDGSGNGYTPGDAITFKFFDNSQDLENSNLSALYDRTDPSWSTDGKFAIGATAFVELNGLTKINQDIALNIGWNIFSTYVVPDNPDMKALFQSLIDAGTLKKVMDETGKTIENFGAFGGWKNNIGNLNSIKGYKVNMISASTLSLQGTPVPLPLDIMLNIGWNIIPYPCSSLQDAKALFQPLIDAGKLKKVMDETGKTIENFGAFGGWKNNIGDFVPGKGYKVNVLENCTLTIPAASIKAAAIIPEVLASTHFTRVFSGNGTDHMTINLVNLQASGLQAGDEIGVFDGKLCVGSAMIGSDQLIAGSISIPASANDEQGESPNGFMEGNRGSVKLYRDNQTYPLTLTKLEGQDIFDKNASLFAQVSIAGATGINDFGSEISFRCYPNPFTEQITIEIQSVNSEKLDINIYDMDGKLVRKLYSGKAHNQGTIVWDGRSSGGSRVVQGTYLINANGKIEKVVMIN